MNLGEFALNSITRRPRRLIAAGSAALGRGAGDVSGISRILSVIAARIGLMTLVNPYMGKWRGSMEIISLGAGVQSSTMALMAAHGEIQPMPDAAIFADTQW